jgi:hypothetical protein
MAASQTGYSLELAFSGKQEGNFPKLEVIFQRRFFLI